VGGDRFRAMRDVPEPEWLRLGEARAKALAFFTGANPADVEAALVHAFYDSKIRTEGKCRAWYEHDIRVAIDDHVWDPDRIRMDWTLCEKLDCFERTEDGQLYLFVEIHVNRRELESWLRTHSDQSERPTDQQDDASHRDEARPKATDQVYLSGVAGRPTSWDLIEAECRRRYAEGERHPGRVGESAAEWARELRPWLQSNHEKAPQPTEKTVSNKLSPLLRELAGDRRKS
jgi:hypothetical protein